MAQQPHASHCQLAIGRPEPLGQGRVQLAKAGSLPATACISVGPASLSHLQTLASLQRSCLTLHAPQDPSSPLLWWQAVICDPSLSVPGPEEEAQRKPARLWPSDRSARLPWPALEAVLQEIVAAGGNRTAYLSQYYPGGKRRHVHVCPSGVLSRGGTGGRCSLPAGNAAGP